MHVKNKGCKGVTIPILILCGAIHDILAHAVTGKGDQSIHVLILNLQLLVSLTVLLPDLTHFLTRPSKVLTLSWDLHNDSVEHASCAE